MVRLPKPSRDVATRVLGEVSFEERLTGIKMRAMAGNQSLPIYSFEEAVNFLHMDSLDDLLRLGSKSYVGYMDLHALSLSLPG